MTISAKRSGRGDVVTGSRDTGRPAPWRRDRHGPRRREGDGLKRLRKRVKVSASGKFAFEVAVGTFFRADAVASRRGRSAALHAARSRCSAPIPCVNPTVNGFAAKSKVVRKK